MILVYVVFCFVVFGCQYQCNRLPGKTRLQNDPICVERDIKPYTATLTSQKQTCVQYYVISKLTSGNCRTLENLTPLRSLHMITANMQHLHIIITIRPAAGKVTNTRMQDILHRLTIPQNYPEITTTTFSFGWLVNLYFISQNATNWFIYVK